MTIGNEIINMMLSGITGFLVVFISIPSIVLVARSKQFVDSPVKRSSHHSATPTLGGLAIFAGLSISSGLWIDASYFWEYQYILAACILLFFVGIKDDILIIAPITKFGGQFAAAFIIIFFADIRITNLHGFFGIHEINYIISITLSLLTILVIINGFNFIDGVDGLSASIGIITTSAFSYWFVLVQEYQLVILAMGLIGSLFAFFLFNVFGNQNKIFMGDTGSLLIGLLVSVLVVKFNELNIDKSKPFAIYPAPAVSFGVLIVPLFDLLRVMFIRFVLSKPLSKPDKNHTHHMLLRLGFGHKKVTFILSLANLFFIYFVFYSGQFLSIRRQLLLILIIALIFSYIPSFILARRKKKEMGNLNAPTNK
jgi:UDP-GlcNAc:undecaprenyl-phosphate/decaprenyl-phosphate GlcNAc-1-phosphate transferase